MATDPSDTEGKSLEIGRMIHTAEALLARAHAAESGASDLAGGRGWSYRRLAWRARWVRLKTLPVLWALRLLDTR
jgi:hypothetical protein